MLAAGGENFPLNPGIFDPKTPPLFDLSSVYSRLRDGVWGKG